MNDDRFHLLLEDYISRSLGEAESRELLEAFSNDPALKTRFIEEVQLSHLLMGLPVAEGNSIAEEVTECLRLGRNAPDLSDAVLAELRSAEPRLVRFPFSRVALAIAAAIAATLLLIFNLRPDPAPTLATVAHVIDAEWSGKQRPQAGERIGSGRLSLASGIARIDFADGVRVTLEGPAEFELIGPGETRLHSGNLTAHVPPEGIGFQVHTARAEIVDLGTTFGVSVGSDGATDVAVFEGEVEVTSVDSREEKIILEGNSVSLDGNTGKMKPAKLEPIAFKADWPVLFGVINTGGRIRFINAQAIRNPIEVVDRENIIVFPERFGTRLKNELLVSITEPGQYRPKDLIDRQVAAPLDSKRVDTYLLQFNPPFVEGAANSDQVSFSGHVTFDRPILAVITDRDLLVATDAPLGKKRFDYPENTLRGLEHSDSLTLSEDRHTLNVDWLVMQSLKRGGDQVRVIVESAEKDPR